MINHLSPLDILNSVGLVLLIMGCFVMAWLRRTSILAFKPEWVAVKNIAEAFFFLRLALAYLVAHYYGVFSLPKDNNALNFLLGDWLLFFCTVCLTAAITGCIIQHALYCRKEARKRTVADG